jgi:hypothetical protein
MALYLLIKGVQTTEQKLVFVGNQFFYRDMVGLGLL